MVSDLVGLVHHVLPQNTKRVKYFCGMTKKLKLIEVYDNLLSFWDDDDDDAYEPLEKLQVSWRNQQIKDIRANLELVQYRLQGVDAVNTVIDGHRLEQVSTIMILRTLAD